MSYYSAPQALRAAPAPRRPAAGPAAAPALQASRLDGVEMAPPDPILVRELAGVPAAGPALVPSLQMQYCSAARQLHGVG